MNAAQLVAAALTGICLVLWLIVRVRLHAFLALITGSLVIGLLAGMPGAAVLAAVTSGAGNTLASIAVIVGLGAMLGRILELSGGMRALATRLVHRFGDGRAQWSMLAVGFIVAIPVFFDVAFVILVSIAYALCQRTGRPLVYYALPLLAGIAVTHAFIPPTPGPIAVAGLLDADLGWVMLFGLLTGLPAAIVAGPLCARRMATKVTGGVPDYMLSGTSDLPAAAPADMPVPGPATIVFLIGLPLLLIVAATVARMVPGLAPGLGSSLAFIGHPVVALLTATLLAYWLLGIRAGYSREALQQVATSALEPAGIVILVTCAGGVLKQVLIDSGVGQVFADWLASARFSPLALAFTAAACIRLIQGSATVAMLTAGGLVAPLLSLGEVSDPMRGLLVIAIAAGATIASHVNDSGFWLVNRYLGLSVADTLRTWTLTSTLVALIAFALILLIAPLLA